MLIKHSRIQRFPFLSIDVNTNKLFNRNWLHFTKLAVSRLIMVWKIWNLACSGRRCRSVWRHNRRARRDVRDDVTRVRDVNWPSYWDKLRVGWLATKLRWQPGCLALSSKISEAAWLRPQNVRGCLAPSSKCPRLPGSVIDWTPYFHGNRLEFWNSDFARC